MMCFAELREREENKLKTIALFLCNDNEEYVTQKVMNGWFSLCCLMTPGLSKDTFGVMCDHTLSTLANPQIRHWAIHKVGS